jgi:N-acetylglucosamine kinase-like BadF-type ATPase
LQREGDALKIITTARGSQPPGGKLPPTPVHLAVDAGGTSTRAVILTPTGHCLGYGKAGSGNPTSAGPDDAAEAVASAVQTALAKGAVTPGQVDSVLLAMAGAGTVSVSATRQSLQAIGINPLPTFASDLLATFCSGTHRQAGYAIVAGTGASAIRADGGRAVATADGLGWLVGDEGSGFWIGWRVARAALADLDNRGPVTALTAPLLSQLGAPGTEQGPDSDGRPANLAFATRALYAMRPVKLAQLAHLAFEAPGDQVAELIVREAADALARTFEAVRRPGLDGPIVLGGGILTHYPVLAGHVMAAITRDKQTPTFTPVPDGVVGAAVLALRGAELTVDKAIFNTITTSLATLR